MDTGTCECPRVGEQLGEVGLPQGYSDLTFLSGRWIWAILDSLLQLICSSAQGGRNSPAAFQLQCRETDDSACAASSDQ